METLAGQAPLSRIEQFFEEYFRIQDVLVDPAFGHFVPMVYDAIGFSSRDAFEPGFVQRFNGLMLRGREFRQESLVRRLSVRGGSGADPRAAASW